MTGSNNTHTQHTHTDSQCTKGSTLCYYPPQKREDVTNNSYQGERGKRGERKERSGRKMKTRSWKPMIHSIWSWDQRYFMNIIMNSISGVIFSYVTCTLMPSQITLDFEMERKKVLLIFLKELLIIGPFSTCYSWLNKEGLKENRKWNILWC